jgi:cobalt-precorrin 5A hydrolase
MNIAIVTINNPSLESATKLLEYLTNHKVFIYNKTLQNTPSYIKFDKLDDILSEVWQYDAIIFLLATGAVIRKIAPFLTDKANDPAVLIVSLDLKKVIPLLSGHLGGANELANELCSKIPNAINFVTTASDQLDRFAFDNFAKDNDFSISNLSSLAKISNAILNKEKIAIISYESIFELIKNYKGYKEENFDFYLIDEEVPKNLKKVYITPQRLNNDDLQLHPKIVLGMGMNRDTKLEEITKNVRRFCFEHSLEFSDILSLASFEAKNDEIFFLEFAKQNNLKIDFFNKEDINSLQNNFSKSMATKFFGIKGVAEPASLLASKYKTLFLNKRIYGNTTIAASF